MKILEVMVLASQILPPLQIVLFFFNKSSIIINLQISTNNVANFHENCFVIVLLLHTGTKPGLIDWGRLRAKCQKNILVNITIIFDTK